MERIKETEEIREKIEGATRKYFSLEHRLQECKERLDRVE